MVCSIKILKGIAYRIRNADVELSHLEIRNDSSPASKNMIVMHGLLGNKLNWRGLCSKPKVVSFPYNRLDIC
jgi:hypothetical protein